MKLNEIINKKTEKGTYAGIKFSEDTNKIIIGLTKQLQLKNPIQENDIHLTLLYSKKYLPTYKPLNDISEIATAKEFYIFNTFDNKNALVLKLNSDWLVNRHNYLMDTHKATYDYPEYIPHITLSYDVGDLDIKNIKINLNDIKFEMIKEYTEDLQLEWKPK